MDGRPRKLAKLQSLRSRLPFISQAALSSILTIARDEELPELSSRKSIRAARDNSVKLDTPYGKLHHVVEFPGTPPVRREIQNPFAILYHACKSSASWSRLVQGLAAARPPSPTSPWHIVLYTDEVLPGNELAYKNARKLWAVYWSILEFGNATLADEDID